MSYYAGEKERRLNAEELDRLCLKFPGVVRVYDSSYWLGYRLTANGFYLSVHYRNENPYFVTKPGAVGFYGAAFATGEEAIDFMLNHENNRLAALEL